MKAKLITKNFLITIISVSISVLGIYWPRFTFACGTGGRVSSGSSNGLIELILMTLLLFSWLLFVFNSKNFLQDKWKTKQILLFVVTLVLSLIIFFSIFLEILFFPMFVSVPFVDLAGAFFLISLALLAIFFFVRKRWLLTIVNGMLFISLLIIFFSGLIRPLC